MLEENARVIRVDAGDVWVETRRRSTCSGCAASNSCGTGVLSRVLGRRNPALRVVASEPLQPGDEVVIGIEESALVQASLAVYLVPLVLLLGGGLAGVYARAQGLVDGEGLSVLLAVLGFVGGLRWLDRFTRRVRLNSRFQPVVLRRLAPASMPVSVNRDISSQEF